MLTSYQASPQTIAHLKGDEGFSARAYLDTKGIPTAGYGRNLQSPGLSRDEVIALLQVVDLPPPIADLMLANDIEAIAHQVAGVIGDDVWPTLSDARQGALIDMGMMGAAKLARFTRMIAAIRSGDWKTASAECLNSTWAKDVKDRRANFDAQLLLTGEWPVP